jgi:mannose-6-phosphate isomerase-like protein (cupin superfamily)
MAPLSTSRAAATYGTTLTFETLTDEAPLRVRPREDTMMRVVAGVVLLRFDGEERVLDAGDEALVPAGFHHTMCALVDEARIVMGFRPAQ